MKIIIIIKIILHNISFVKIIIVRPKTMFVFQTFQVGALVMIVIIN